VAAPVERPYLLERIDDAAVAQVYADGFDALSVEERKLAWHLVEAALWGRDIYYDQRYRHGLEMRELLEQVILHGDAIEAGILAEVRRYTKLFWMNSGPYNNMTARKFVLDVTKDQLLAAARSAAAAGARLPCAAGETVGDLVDRLAPAFLDPAFEPLVTNKNPEGSGDMLAESANNLYADVIGADLEGFTERHPLNSRLIKRDGRLVEEVYCRTGRYGAYIARIIEHLEAAIPLAPAPMQRALEALVGWYETGDDEARLAYDRAWVADQDSPLDSINGFIEVYMDPRGHKGAWEGLVFCVNRAKTEAVTRIAAHAQWFEDRMPWNPAWRRHDVRGVSARAIDVLLETGDAGPLTPIGINLPNDQAVREAYGSKSVSLSNVLDAYDRSLPRGYHAEFSWDAAETDRAERWSHHAGELSTNLHEIIGHGSGLVEERLGGAPQAFLREYYSAIEETRADLVALYFIADPKMVDLDLVPAEHFEAIVRAEYEAYARNVLVQLRRVREGTRIEEDHMRNRQLIIRWLEANTAAVRQQKRDGKTYLVVTSTAAFRAGVAELLAEVQRIKAQGDHPAARALVETYGIVFASDLRDEIVRRVETVGLPSYTGFVMPDLVAVRGPGQEIADVRIAYPCDLTAQMLDYSARYCLRPVPCVGPAPGRGAAGAGVADRNGASR
jgi:dipeptidyl-peptidase-3